TSDRFPYWPRRIARGGETLAPAPREHPTQFVDARDLAEWMVGVAQQALTGPFNATGTPDDLTLGVFLERTRDALAADTHFTWVDEGFLLERGVRPWTELPLWVPMSESDFERLDVRRAVSAGLSFRPVEDTVRDTLAWDRATPRTARPPRMGLAMPPSLDPARERELLAEWHALAGA
ncbi:MAG: epimerase, partial [Candidatus Eisenbacteria bacterium]